MPKKQKKIIIAVIILAVIAIVICLALMWLKQYTGELMEGVLNHPANKGFVPGD